jgi:pimeloyl-ACP methyl ester carboxylesterase
MGRSGPLQVAGDERHDPNQDRGDRQAHWLSWRQIHVDGTLAAYGEAGSGPPVVFLHGWGLDHRAYKRALARLASHGMRVIAPALPGFGGTPGMRREAVELAGFARWVADFLDALGISEPVHLMGHSFGGGVAIVFAHDYPDRVHDLVLINSIGASAWVRRGNALQTIEQRSLFDWGIHFRDDVWPLEQARRVLPVIVSEALPNLLREPQSFVRVAGIARRADLRRELEELRRRRLPVVVLWGKRDRIITRESFEEMCEVLGQPQSMTVEGSHSWLISDPDAFGEIMTNVVDVAASAKELKSRKRRRGWSRGTPR